MGIFSFFGGGDRDSDHIESYLEKKAIVIDVRTPMEFNGGNAEGSINIPLDRISQEIAKILKYKKPIITVCRSGARSGSAANFLKDNGVDAINGGPWQNVAKFVN